MPRQNGRVSKIAEPAAHAVKLAAINALLGAAVAFLGLSLSSLRIPIVWLGLSFVYVGLTYAFRAPSMLGKRMDGSVAWWSWLGLLPWHLFLHGVWHLARMTVQERAWDQVSPTLTVGRRLLASDLPTSIQTVVDLTAEFPEPRGVRGKVDYRLFPVLDASVPDVQRLREFVRALPDRHIYVHCAQGHGRTGVFAMAFLIMKGGCKSTGEALALLQAARPALALNHEQTEFMKTHFDTQPSAS